jgi:hypothetical protein
MRLVLVFIAVFSCFISKAQEVRISPGAAEFYLEVYDKYQILTKKDSLNEQIIEHFQYSINTRDLLISNMRQSEKALTKVIALKDEQNQLSEEEIKYLKKQLRKEKFKTIAVAVGSGVLILLILI